MQGIRNNLSVNNFDLCAPPYICMPSRAVYVSLSLQSVFIGDWDPP